VVSASVWLFHTLGKYIIAFVLGLHSNIIWGTLIGKRQKSVLPQTKKSKSHVNYSGLKLPAKCRADVLKVMRF